MSEPAGWVDVTDKSSRRSYGRLGAGHVSHVALRGWVAQHAQFGFATADSKAFSTKRQAQKALDAAVKIAALKEVGLS